MGPWLKSSPRHLQHGTHGDSHAPPVPGIRTFRGNEHCIRTESGYCTEDRPHIGVIHDVDEYHDSTCIADDFVDTWQAWALNGRKGSSVDSITGYPLKRRSLRDVDRGTSQESSINQVRGPIDPAVLHDE